MANCVFILFPWFYFYNVGAFCFLLFGICFIYGLVFSRSFKFLSHLYVIIYCFDHYIVRRYWVGKDKFASVIQDVPVQKKKTVL